MRRVLALSALALAATFAAAGAFNQHDGAAIHGYDPVAYFVEGKPVRGSASHTAVHEGTTFRFASAANRDAFAGDPARYAPQYGGYCAYGAARGYKADIQPAMFTIVGGKLYLNHSPPVQAAWLKDVPGQIRKADSLWPETRKVEKVLR